MRIEAQVVNHVAVVRLHGDIVLNGPGPALSDEVRRLLDQGCRRIVLDVGDVRYVDSGGIGELIEAVAAARHRGGVIKLLGVTRRLHDLLAVIGLLDVFEHFDSEVDAVRSCARP